MRKKALEQLLITVLAVLLALGIATAAVGGYLKWSA